MDAQQVLAELIEPSGRADPYPLYARLHAMGEAVPAGPGLVLVAGYDAISSVLRDPSYRVTDAAIMDQDSPGWRDHPALSMDAILSLNPPAHTRIRAMIAGTFTPRRLARLEPAIARMTDDLLDSMAGLGSDGGPVDFMHEFAYLLPVTVICELIGIPDADREAFRPAARDLAATVEFEMSPEVLAAADKSALWLNDYFTDLAAQRRARPREDLLSALVGITDEGGLTTSELLDNLVLLLVAGFETTTNLLGNGLHLVLAEPRMGAALRAGAIPVPSFVEEVLRYDSPVQMTSRRATAAGEVGGVPVAPGEGVLLVLGAGNRDGRRFPEPDVFNPQRAVSGPLSFGAGPHFCVGSALARLEAAVAFPRLLTRFPELTSAGDPVRRTGLVLRGFDTLPVTLG
jgi:cytochrome P450